MSNNVKYETVADCIQAMLDEEKQNVDAIEWEALNNQEQLNYVKKRQEVLLVSLEQMNESLRLLGKDALPNEEYWYETDSDVLKTFFSGVTGVIATTGGMVLVYHVITLMHQ